ncbi:MAG: hypothetical protein V7750_12865 [Sneathiella sp.]
MRSIKPMTDRTDESEETEPECIESNLDDKTHAEMLALYAESARTILFAKNRQWRTLGAVCFAHIILVAAAYLFILEPYYLQTLVILSFLISSMAICILIIYQIWQHTEKLKLQKISVFLSNYFTLIRQIKQRRDANIHRYVLLIVMIASIFVANTISYILYLPKLPS